MGRDPVEESFAIRYKKLEADMCFLEFRKARSRGDLEKMEECKIQHERIVSEYDELAESYEKRFLD
jgi:hypothetical protein